MMSYVNLKEKAFQTFHNIKRNLCVKTEILPCIPIKYSLLF